MEDSIFINGKSLTLKDYEKVALHNCRVELDSAAYTRVMENRKALESVVENGNVIYGINSGFGPMCNRIIPSESIDELQVNLIRSHSSGHGNPLCKEVVRGCMLLRANNLARGYSGVRPDAIELLVKLLNADLCPLIPERGSVGASGDLVHLAHLALVLIGEGKIQMSGEWRPTGEVFKELDITPLTPSFKEGLALINGTSMTTSLGCFAVLQAKKLVQLSRISVAIGLEVLGGTTEAFSPELHSVKSHWGQKVVAELVSKHLQDSNLTRQNETVFEQLKEDLKKETLLTSHITIQDAYSLRCVPQILGVVVETINFVETILEKEINSTSDNPIVIDHLSEVSIYHGGHFHAQYCSMVLDYLSIAIAEIGVLAERQINRLTNDKLNGNLPPFLIPEQHGLRCGLMGVQYLASSTTAELQALCAPISIHSIPTNADNQDIVSMGPSSALRSLEQVERVCRIFAVQLLCLVQGLDFCDIKKAGKQTQEIYGFIRDRFPSIVEDRPMYTVIDELMTIMGGSEFKHLIGLKKDEELQELYDYISLLGSPRGEHLQESYEHPN